jgi:hypothetical protein
MPTWMIVAGAVASGAVQFVLFLRWLHRRMRDDEIARVFIRDLAQNHLPILYRELHYICDHLGIEAAEVPPIQFVDFHKNGRKAS